MNLRTRAFTLLELILVITIVAALAGIASLEFSSFIDRSRTAAAQSVVYAVRGKLQEHLITTGAYPDTIDPSWFGSDMVNPWKPEAPGEVEVDRHASRLYPPQKRANGGREAFWYNPALGSFCARVETGLSGPDTLAQFNEVNGARLAALGHTR